jgi:hypothetical protein
MSVLKPISDNSPTNRRCHAEIMSFFGLPRMYYWDKPSIITKY